jgi:hypothetical protein
MRYQLSRGYRRLSLPKPENSATGDMVVQMANETEQGEDGIFTVYQKKLICKNKLADYKSNFEEKVHGRY